MPLKGGGGVGVMVLAKAASTSTMVQDKGVARAVGTTTAESDNGPTGLRRSLIFQRHLAWSFWSRGL
jgi:hypothetical protein